MTVDDALQRNGTGAEVGIPGVVGSIDLCRGDACVAQVVRISR